MPVYMWGGGGIIAGWGMNAGKWAWGGGGGWCRGECPPGWNSGCWGKTRTRRTPFSSIIWERGEKKRFKKNVWKKKKESESEGESDNLWNVSRRHINWRHWSIWRHHGNLSRTCEERTRGNQTFTLWGSRCFIALNRAQNGPDTLKAQIYEWRPKCSKEIGVLYNVQWPAEAHRFLILQPQI